MAQLSFSDVQDHLQSLCSIYGAEAATGHHLSLREAGCTRAAGCALQLPGKETVLQRDVRALRPCPGSLWGVRGAACGAGRDWDMAIPPGHPLPLPFPLPQLAEGQQKASFWTP